MTKVIGLVCEGPRDAELISGVIDSLFPEDHLEYRYLQPDPSLLSCNYNGWKGVFRWCRKDYQAVCGSKDYLAVEIDLIIVQVDGDVSRDDNNKQSHCNCSEYACPEREKLRIGEVVPFEDCSKALSECPVQSPCSAHPDDKPGAFISHLEKIVNTYLGYHRPIPVMITIPCDSTDAWVVAAFEDSTMEYELQENPWETIISRKKDYYGIRIPGRKKSKRAYRELIKMVTANWPLVVSKCTQACHFQKEITTALARVSGTINDRDSHKTHIVN